MSKLIWTKPAVDDLEAIKEYIAKDSEYYARIFVGKLVIHAEKLLSFPKIGRIVPEYNRENIRELIYRNYRIIYKLEQERTLILTVVHGKQDLLKQNEES